MTSTAELNADHIENKLSAYPPERLRALISRVARNTPGVIYHSRDFDPVGLSMGDGNSVIPGLFLLGAQAARQIGLSDTANIEFKGLSHETEGDYGDWSVKITRQFATFSESDATPPAQDEKDLGCLPAEIIRSILSKLSDLTPKTIYIDKNFGVNYPEKTIVDGSALTIAGEAAMYVCSSLKHILTPGQTWECRFISSITGSAQVNKWHIRITRQSA